MAVRTIRVSIDEKRNHPFAYGNYAAGASFEIEVSEELGEWEIMRVTTEWQEKARAVAVGECDRWEAQVRREKEFDKLRGDANFVLRDVRWHGPSEHAAQRFQKATAGLPDEEKADLNQRWEDAVTSFNAGERELSDDVIGF